MKTIDKLLLILLVAIFSMASCDDHDVEEPQMNNEIIKDNLFSAKIVSDVFFNVNSGKKKNKSLNKNGDCISVESDTTQGLDNMKLYITYNNCSDHGSVKNGKIAVQFSILDTKGFAKLQFENFSVDGNIVEGSMEIGFLELNQFKTVSDLTLTYADGSKTEWKEEITFKLLSEGKWELNGMANGKTRNGKTFVRISSGLVFNPACTWYVGGSMELTVANKDIYNITFSSECGEINYSHNGIKTKQSL